MSHGELRSSRFIVSKDPNIPEHDLDKSELLKKLSMLNKDDCTELKGIIDWVTQNKVSLQSEERKILWDIDFHNEEINRFHKLTLLASFSQAKPLNHIVDEQIQKATKILMLKEMQLRNKKF
ncbi:hypothetical protein WA026_009920 [Henosepilachna vigintioctopunctata]|uniref:Uncharacterized protein n=1 Tax=Henosepilachna vigintioctopunctata TaxID=420089 RepID=A0AAW1TQM7_9CUCU